MAEAAKGNSPHLRGQDRSSPPSFKDPPGKERIRNTEWTGLSQMEGLGESLEAWLTKTSWRREYWRWFLKDE